MISNINSILLEFIKVLSRMQYSEFFFYFLLQIILLIVNFYKMHNECANLQVTFKRVSLLGKLCC